MPNIHPTAQVSPKAELADDVQVGPYAIITDHVRIGQGTSIGNHATITGRTTIGEHNNIYPYTALGLPPQDLTYKNESTNVEIGDHNTIREFVTINAGSLKEDGKTIVGSHNYLMAYCHIAHDCLLEDNIVMANGVQLGGHIRIEQYASLGGMVGVHHFVTIGQYSFIAGGVSRVIQDVPPYMLVEGYPAEVRSINIVGLKRRNFSPEAVQALKDAYKLIWRSRKTATQALQLLKDQKGHIPEIKNLVEFLSHTQQGKQGRARERVRKPQFHPYSNLTTEPHG